MKLFQSLLVVLIGIYDDAAERLKLSIKNNLAEIEKMGVNERVDYRINKYGNMGFWEEVEEEQVVNG